MPGPGPILECEVTFGLLHGVFGPPEDKEHCPDRGPDTDDREQGRVNVGGQ